MSVFKGSTKVAGNSAVHTHSNKNVIDKFSESGGVPYYNGSPIGGASNVSDIGDLDDVTLTSLSDGQILRYDDIDDEWKNQDLQEGHVMLPVPSSALTASQLVAQVNGTSNTNENVASLWGVKTWSNCDVVTLTTTVARDTLTVGAWDNGWKESGASREGWLWHEALHGILSDDSVEIEIVFDLASEETIGVYAYRIDDDVQNNGVDGGAMAIRFNEPIHNVSGVKIGVNLKRQRTQVSAFTVLS